MRRGESKAKGLRRGGRISSVPAKAKTRAKRKDATATGLTKKLATKARESLEQQTATSEGLQVISSSSGDLQPIFETMLANARRQCGAKFGTLHLYDGGEFHSAASHNTPPALADLRHRFRPHPESGPGYVAKTKRVAHYDDIRTGRAYLEGSPVAVALADLAGVRTTLSV